MAADVMLKVDADLNPIEKRLVAFQKRLNALQKEAATSGSANVKIPKVDPGVLTRIANPTLPAGLDPKSEKARAAAIRQQSELIALKLKELDVDRRSRKEGPLTFERGSVGQRSRLELVKASRESLAGLGFDVQTTELRKSVEARYKSLGSDIQSLVSSGLTLPKAFVEVGTAVSARHGVGPTTLTTFAKADAENAAKAKSVAAAEAEAAANTDAAKAARLRAEQEEWGAKRAAEIDKEILAALKKVAKEAEKRAAAARKQFERENPILGPGRPELNKVHKAYDRDFDSAQKELLRRETAAAKEVEKTRTQEETARDRQRRQEEQMWATREGAGARSKAQADKAAAKGAEAEIAADRARLDAQIEADKKHIDARKKFGKNYAVGGEAFERIEKMENEAAVSNMILDDENTETRYKMATSAIAKTRTKLNEISNLQLIIDKDYLESSAALAASKDRLAAAVNAEILADPDRVRARAERGLSSLELRSAAGAVTAGDEDLAERDRRARVLDEKTKRSTRNRVLSDLLDDADFQDALRQEEANRKKKRQIANPGPRGLFEGFGQTEGGNLGAFFGKGLGSVLKYAVPSAVLFGATAGLADAVKDSEDLAVSFTKLDSQLKGFDDSQIREVKEQIIGLSKDSGIAAAELADVAIQIQGAFGNLSFDKLDPTGSLGGLKGSDNLIRYGQDAAKIQLDAATKLSKVTGISEAELVDGLTAASFAFGASADRIGDISTKLETTTGVKAKETISFLGDIGPSAREAGFSLEEISALAAQIQKRSGQAGSAIAEQLTRVFAALGGNAEDFFNLANSNKFAFGDRYEDFIKAVQDNDAKETFNILADKFQNLNKTSKDFVVNLLGGQRQANTLLAAFGDSKGLEEANKAAADAAGTLDERYLKLQERISSIFSRLKTNFNDLVKAVLDAGLGDAVSNIAGAFEKIFKLTTAILSPIGELNRVLGGLPSKIGGIAFQIIAVRGALLAVSSLRGPAEADASTGMAARIGTLLGATGTGAGGRFRGRDMLFPGTRQAYRDSIAKQMARPPGTFDLNPQRVPTMTKVKASGSALKTLVGGLPGVGFLAATGAFAAYDAIAGAIDADAAKVREFRAKISTKSVEELEQMAKDIKSGSKDNDQGFWASIFDPRISRSEQIEDEVRSRQVKPQADLLSQAALVDPEKISKLIFASSGQDRKEIRDVIRDNIIQFDNVESSFSSDLANIAGGNEFREQIEKATGRSIEELDPAIKQVLANSQESEIPADLAKIDLSSVTDDKARKSARDQINALIAFYTQLGQSSEGTQQLFTDLRDSGKQLLNAQGDAAFQTLEAQKAAFQDGQLSLTEYVASLDQKIAQQRGLKTQSKESAKIISNALRDRSEAISSYVIERQERNLEVMELLGASESEINLRSIEYNTAILDNPDITNIDIKRKAAMGLLANTVAFNKELLAKTEDIELARKMIREGFEIPAATRQAFLQSDIETSDEYLSVAKFLQAFRNSAKKGSTTYSEEASKLFKTAGFDTEVGPAGFISKYLTEFFENGALKPETINDLTRKYNLLLYSLQNNEKLTSTDKQNIEGTLDVIIEILGMAGMIPKSALNGSFKGIGKRLSRNFLGKFGTVFGQKILPGKGFLGDEDIKERERQQDSVENAYFGYLNARADGNAAELARIAKAQAERKREKAKVMTGPEGQAAQWEAEEAILRADQSMADYLKSVKDGQISYIRAVAEDNGDLVAAARAGLAQAQSDLAFAQSRGDVAGIQAAQTAILQANAAIRDAIQAQRDAQVEYLRAVLTKDDPVKQAQFDLNMARIQESEARGLVEKTQAALAILESERELRDAMSESRMALFNLREAQLSAMDDEVGAANVSAQAARAQLADAQARGAGAAEIANLQAGVITADKAARDTLFQTKLDDYKYLLDTGKITKSQYVKYLEAIQQTLQPGTKQFKELELTLRQLKSDISGDLQANLPTALDLPTLYSVRRLGQLNPDTNAVGGPSVGYQDNRTQDIKIYVGQNMTESQVVQVVANALGTNRNALTAPKRY